MNISEIAKLAGVSRAAVSRYLNQGYLSEEKAEKIRCVIEETGYVPSAQAQTLRTKKTKLIGIIVPKISSEAVSRMVDGITGIAEADGYQILLANTDHSLQKELDYLNIFHTKQVDGVILIATMFTKEHHRALAQMIVPVVLLGQCLDPYPSVFYDDYGSIYDMTQYLTTQGKQRIGFIGVDEHDVAAGLMRKRGYEQGMKDAGLPVEQGRIAAGGFHTENGYVNARKILEEYPDTDGFVCATDSIAIGALRYLKEKKIPVPGRVAVSGVGDTGMSQVVEPGLTTVHLHYKTAGEEAAKLLVCQMKGEEREPVKRILGYEIMKRQSVSGG